MAFTYAHGLILVAAAAAATSLLGVSMAEKIIVGGESVNWRFGFNYSDWALNTPFFFNDTLVFKYDPPSNTTAPHNVYLFQDPSSYFRCDFKGAKLIANTTQGGGDGFQFVLNEWKPYFFACGVGNGTHCNQGGMRFVAQPVPR